MSQMDEEAEELRRDLFSYYSNKVGVSLSKAAISEFERRIRVALVEAYSTGYKEGRKDERELHKER
jgi:hypothetical protein